MLTNTNSSDICRTPINTLLQLLTHFILYIVYAYTKPIASQAHRSIHAQRVTCIHSRRATDSTLPDLRHSQDLRSPDHLPCHTHTHSHPHTHTHTLTPSHTHSHTHTHTHSSLSLTPFMAFRASSGTGSPMSLFLMAVLFLSSW